MNIEIIRIENEMIAEHRCGIYTSLPDGWIQVPDGWNGATGTSVNRYHEDWSLKTEEELIEEGIISDNRGDWYSTETREWKEVKFLDEPIPEGHTKLSPLGYESAIWDTDKEEWKENWTDIVNRIYDQADGIARQSLSDLDYVGNKISTGVATIEEYSVQIAEQETHRETINALPSEKEESLQWFTDNPTEGEEHSQKIAELRTRHNISAPPDRSK